MSELIPLARQARVFDLAQTYYTGMPHFPTHPPFSFSLTKQHGDFVTAGGASSAADAIALGGHVGTHIDALCHFSCGGRMFGGIEVSGVQSYGGGLGKLSVDSIGPIVRRGILLDIAGLSGSVLAPDFSIAPCHLDAACEKQGVRCSEGDVVLVRTGWAQYWDSQARYLHGPENANAVVGPGPEIEAARWLSSRKVFAAGSDTIGFERMPSREMAVHVHLLVDNGIYIIEALNLEEIARERVYEFLFIAAPLKLRGGTGSPIRPVALVQPAA